MGYWKKGFMLPVQPLRHYAVAKRNRDSFLYISNKIKVKDKIQAEQKTMNRIQTSNKSFLLNDC